MDSIVEAWIYDKPSARLASLVERANGGGIVFVYFILYVIPLDDKFLLWAGLDVLDPGTRASVKTFHDQ